MIYFKTPISFKNNSRSFRIKKTLVIYMPGSLIGRIIISMVCRVSASEKGMIAIELNVHAHSIAVSLIEVIIATLYATACCPNIVYTVLEMSKGIAKGMP
jgi:hypothetical protein